MSRSRRPAPPSIRARLTLTFAVSIAILLLLGSGIALLTDRAHAVSNADRLLHASAERMRVEYATGEDRENLSARLREDLPELRASGLTITLYDDPAHEPDRGQVLTGQEVVPLCAPPSGSRPDGQPTPDGRWRVARVDSEGAALMVGYPWALTDGARLQREMAMLGLLSLCMVAAAALGAYLTVGKTLQPIYALSGQAEHFAAAEPDPEPETVPFSAALPQLIAPSRDREITHLVATLNTLLSREAAVLAARGRFYAAASHELRTPLQGLCGYLELALSRPTRTETEYREALGDALAQAERLSALTQDLLLLNRLEGQAEAAHRAPPEPVDLSDLCRRLLATVRSRLEARNVHLETHFEPDLIRTLPAGHAFILLRNLIDNAARYVAPGGRVRLETASAADGAGRVSLFNSYPLARSLPLERLAEPFYRPDPLESLPAAEAAEALSSAATGGNGLGLTICRALAAANHWDMQLRRTPEDDGGILVQVTFPAQQG